MWWISMDFNNGYAFAELKFLHLLKSYDHLPFVDAHQETTLLLNRIAIS
jgi:hypothetical protein